MNLQELLEQLVIIEQQKEQQREQSVPLYAYVEEDIQEEREEEKAKSITVISLV